MLVIAIFYLNIMYSFLSFLFPFQFPSLPLPPSVSLCFLCWKKQPWIQHSNTDSIFKHIPNVKWDGQTLHCSIFFLSRNRKLALMLSFWEPISQEKAMSKVPASIFFYILSILFIHRMLHISIPYVNKNTHIFKNMWNIISKVWDVDVYHNIVTDAKLSK